MSKAFDCDMCGAHVSGDAETKVKATKFIVAVNYSPEVVDEIVWHRHDLCRECSDFLVKVWHERRAGCLMRKE